VFNSRREYAEVGDVAQLSRPYQIALGAVALLGLVWVFALRAHNSNPSEPAPSSATPVATSSAPAKAATPTTVYHGAAPGVEGLTRAVAKARGAVATSQQNADQLQRKSARASDETHAPATAPANVAAAKAPSSAAATQQSIVAAELARHAARTHSRSGPVSKRHVGRNHAQVAVEGELAHGKTVMLLFWNPKSSVDQEVKTQAAALANGSKGAVTMHAALAHEVGTFGTITEVAHVYQTPTILIVNRHGVVSTLTGLTDLFALRQALREARGATR
jgi:hypothetical protein